MDLSKMPNKILERIFSYLSFAEVSQLRGLSKNIHCIARQILNAAFLDLGPRLATQYTSHLIHAKNNSSDDSPEDLAFRGRLLKLLSSEHSILLAFCRHYIPYGVRCFSAGEILDLFYKLQTNESSRESPDDENNETAKLILLIDQYLDWFEKYRMLNEKRCPWFGACIVDLLDSYQSSKYHLSASFTGSYIKLAGQYTINGYAEAPPEIGNPLGCEISQYELLQILRYLRKHARWHNFVMTLQDNNEQEDVEPERERIYTKRTAIGYDVFYKKKPHGVLDNRDNVISIRAVISLQCHRSLAPARLCNRHDLKKIITNDDEKLTKIFSRDSMSDDSKDLHRIVENSCNPLRLMSNGTISLNDQKKKEEIYNFGLEIKVVYPKKWTGSNHGIGEKFGETTLNINHTFDSIFAANSQFRLF